VSARAVDCIAAACVQPFLNGLCKRHYRNSSPHALPPPSPLASAVEAVRHVSMTTCTNKRMYLFSLFILAVFGLHRLTAAELTEADIKRMQAIGARPANSTVAAKCLSF